MIDCSKVTETICYVTTRSSTGSLHIQVAQVNFNSLRSFKYYDINSDDYTTASISAVNDEGVIGSAHKKISDNEHTFYRLNYTSDDFDWAISSANIGK